MAGAPLQRILAGYTLAGSTEPADSALSASCSPRKCGSRLADGQDGQDAHKPTALLRTWPAVPGLPVGKGSAAANLSVYSEEIFIWRQAMRCMQVGKLALLAATRGTCTVEHRHHTRHRGLAERESSNGTLYGYEYIIIFSSFAAVCSP